MWRRSLSIVFSAILESAAATTIYTIVGSLWSGSTIPINVDGLRLAMIVCLAAMWFTLPGAMFLAAIEFALRPQALSELRLDGVILSVGALVGVAILSGLSFSNPDALLLAALGGFYGLTTALIFVIFQRWLGLRPQRLL